MDDCSAIAFDDTIWCHDDMLHKKRTFARDERYQIGGMATAATLSDTSMGAPLATMALGIPREADVAFALDVVRGCTHAARKWDALIGATQMSTMNLRSWACLGRVQQDKMLSGTGRNRERVCVTGD